MKQKNHRLNSVSAGTEAVMNVVLALFSLCCIIPFIFVVIISFSSEESIRTIGYSFWPMAWSTDTYAYGFEHPDLRPVFLRALPSGFQIP